MLNLILKDILLQKRSIALMLFYGIIFIIAFQGSEVSAFVAVLVAITYTSINTVAAIEEKNKADIILNSLPIKRGRIILAKYISLFAYMLMGVLSYLAATTIIKTLNLPIKVFPITIEAFIGAVSTVVFMNSIYLPVFFKYGYTKSRVVSFILFFSMFFGVSSGIAYLKAQQDINWIRSILGFLASASELQITAFTIGIILLMLLCSYIISLKIYKNREF